jgi:nucleotide-binding universal stress UspA family protein
MVKGRVLNMTDECRSSAMIDEHLIMEQQPSSVAARDAASCSIKTIALHILDDEFHDQRIDTALSLARACSAHIRCLHVTPIEAYVAFENFAGVFVMEDVMRRLDERSADLELRVRERFKTEDVSWDYEHLVGYVASALLSHAALADILITSRQPLRRNFVGPTVGFLGDLLFRSRTPLLIPASDGNALDPTGLAMIAWNGNIEGAHAVRASLGLLKLASEVHLIEISEDRNDDRKAFPATDVLEYLSRHGIHANLKVEEAPAGHASQDVVSGMIVAEASAAGASYIVMGGYSHTRLGEYVFGGVTRTLLKQCSVPLVIAH